MKVLESGEGVKHTDKQSEIHMTCVLLSEQPERNWLYSSEAPSSDGGDGSFLTCRLRSA